MRYSAVPLVFVLTVLACGDDAGAPDGSETGPCYANGTCNARLECLSGVCVDTKGGAAEPGPVCHSADLINSTAVEKVNAAFCFGLAFEGASDCRFNAAADITRCTKGEVAYYVTHRETQSGTLGEVFDAYDDSPLGLIRQSSTGLFAIEFWLEPPATGRCSVTGDVATLCVAF